MRAYFWGNMYLSSIQQGIQSAHCLAEIYEGVREHHHEQVKHLLDLQMKDWAQDHKTMILLNGGYSENLHRLVSFMSREQNMYPWGCFHEGEDALDGALTCVGIVLPGVIYNGASCIRRTSLAEVEMGKFNDERNVPEGLRHDFWVRLTDWERDLVMELNSCGLAS
jgi:hypothetical protein